MRGHPCVNLEAPPGRRRRRFRCAGLAFSFVPSRVSSPIWPLTRRIVGSVPVGVAEAPRTRGNRRLELPFSFIVAA